MPPDRDDLAMMREQLAHCRNHVRALADLARRGALGETTLESAAAASAGRLRRQRVAAARVLGLDRRTLQRRLAKRPLRERP